MGKCSEFEEASENRKVNKVSGSQGANQNAGNSDNASLELEFGNEGGKTDREILH